MWNRLLKPMVFCLGVALISTAPARAVEEVKISSYGNGNQIWFEVENFDERDPADDTSFVLSDVPGAFGRSINSVNGSDGNGMIRYTFDISKAGGSGGPWYFWGRVINPSNNSDFMLVDGHPGDPVPFTQPVGGLVNDQRVFEESLGSLPDGWAWSGDNHDEAHTKTLKNGENTMYIISRESGASWDVFMWTDDPDYVPTDEDYLNAKAPVAGTPSNPSPAGGAVDVPRDAMLSWAPGELAVTHQVYFGTSLEDVSAAGSGSALLIGKDLTTTSLALDRLDFGQAYYWRVDEVNGAPDYTVIKGNVWSFEVEPFSVLVESVTAMASSSDINKDPSSTINGSGLDPDTGFHSTQETAQWTSAMTQDPGSPVFIQYDFDRPYKLHEVKIWNSNLTVENVLGFGFKDTIITYSLDGVEWTRLGGDEGLVQLTRGPGNESCPGQTVTLDVVARSVKLTAVSNYSQYFKQYGLSEVQFYAIPTHARTPNPVSGTQGVDPRSTVLSWRSGREAGQHNVLMGEDPNALDEAHTVSTNSLALDSLDLSLDTIYYWRVDEVNDAEAPAVWAGPVWSLSTPASLIVDDFEGYSNFSPDRPFQTWLDGYGYSADEFFPADNPGNGTGAGIGHDVWGPSSPHFGGSIMETASTAPGSSQSMPFYYNNTGGVASQTERSFAVPQDWTIGRVKTLSIAFRGKAGNTGTLFTMINNTKVTYSQAPGSGLWHYFNIDLSSVNTNLQSVTKLTIGIDGGNASGMILIDDIRLYPDAGPADPGVSGLPLIAWVSFHADDNVPSSAAAGAGFTEAPDKAYTDLLTANGYEVIRYLTTSTPDPDVLGAVDLVIISRSVASGGYQDDGASAWNNIAAPMIITGGYTLRSSRMGFTVGATIPDTTGDIKLKVNNPSHPIFAGIKLAGGTMVNPFAGLAVYPTDGVTMARGISVNTDSPDDDGTLLATVATAGDPAVGGMVIGEWQAGGLLKHTGGALADTLAGHRLVFLTGGREANGISGDTAGLYDLYEDGEQMFLNAVEYMLRP